MAKGHPVGRLRRQVGAMPLDADLAFKNSADSEVRHFRRVGPQGRIDSLEGLLCAPSVPLNEEHSKERRAEFERELAKIAPNRNPKDKNWQAGRAPSQALRWAVDALCKAGTLSIIGV